VPDIVRSQSRIMPPGAGGGQNPPRRPAEGDRADPFRRGAEDREDGRLHGEAPQPDGPVVAAGGKQLAVAAEGETADRLIVAEEDARRPGDRRGNVPEADGRVLPARGEGRAVRRERQAQTLPVWPSRQRGAALRGASCPR
jgi:hypothetical protein